jgi:hypothetical protein
LKQAKVLTADNIALLESLAGGGTVTWQMLDEAARRYGIDISTLGGTFQAQRLHDGWQQIIDDLDLFARGGADMDAVIAGMGPKISELVQQSIHFGTTIPENMRPWIQKLIDTGLLVDENGEKIKDLSGITFGETLQTTLQALVDTLKDLILTLGGIPTDVTAPRVHYPAATYDEDTDGGHTPAPYAYGGVVVPFGYRRPVYAARGFWAPQGTDTVPAMLTPGEIVLNAAQQKRVAGAIKGGWGAARPVINLRSTLVTPDGRTLLEFVSKEALG